MLVLSVSGFYMKTLLNIFKKILLGLTALLLVLLLLIFLFFQLPAVQNFVADKALRVARDKLDTEIGLESVIIVPPNSVKLKEIYLEGKEGDTLFYSKELSVNIALFKLFNKEIELNRLKISSTSSKLIRSGLDSTFNFPGIKKSAKREKPDKEKSGIDWTFNIDRVILDKVDFLFEDRNLGNRYAASIGNLKLRMKTLDPQIPEIGVQSIKLSESDVQLDIQTAGTKNKEKEGEIPDIWLNRDIEIEDVNFLMLNYNGGQKIAVNNINLFLRTGELNLPEKRISVDEINLEETELVMVPLETSSEKTREINDKSKTFEWDFSVAGLKLTNNHINIQTERNPLPSQGFDPKNMRIQKLNGKFKAVKFNRDSVLAEISELQFVESNRFRLENFSTSISATRDKAEIENLVIKTPYSFINLDLHANNYNLQNINNTWKEIFVELNLEESHAGMNDISFFYPDFPTGEYHDLINQMVLKTELNGSIANISLENFRANVNKEMILKLNGKITGMPEFKKLTGTFSIDSIFIADNNARQYFPDTLIPEQIYIPENLLIEGVARGNTMLSKSKLDISSDAGEIYANLQLNIDTTNEKEFFQADINTDRLDLGRIMQKPDTLGKIFMTVSLNGSSSNFKDPRADLKLDIDSFHFIQYPYSNFNLKGKIAGRSFEGTAGINDENIRFSFNGRVDASDSIPDMDFTFNLIGANLMALNIAEEDIRIGAIVSSSVSGSNLDDLAGQVKLNNMIFVRNNEIHELDSLLLTAENQGNMTELTASSRILQARYKGSVKPSDISSELWSHLNIFFTFRESKTKKSGIAKTFRFEAHVEDHPLISRAFLPELVNFNGIDIQIEYNEENNLLTAKSIIAPLHYRNMNIDSVHINLNTKDSIMLFKLDSKGFTQDLINIPGILAEARLGNDSAKWKLKLTDQQSKEKYHIRGTLSKDEKFITAKIDPSKLILNYETWSLPPDHAFKISEDSTIFKHLNFNNEPQILSLSKKTSGPGIRGTQIDFRAFELETITNLFAAENFLDAKINGNIIFDQENRTRFTSELQINDLYSYGDKLFNTVSIKSGKPEKNRITFKGQLENQEEKISLQGSYSLLPENEINLDVNIQDLEMQNYQPLLSDVFKTLTGTFNGDLNLSGPIDQLNVNGDLQFIDGKIAPRTLGTTFRSKNIQLNFDNNDLQFTHFDILDTDGNEASVSGSINQILSESPKLNLTVNADNFTGIHVKEGVNDQFFGKLSMDISANLKGEISQPVISGATTITNNTDFHFIVPTPDKATIEQEGLVVFIEPQEDTVSILYSGLKQEQASVQTDRNMDITATLEVRKNALIDIIVDPASRENLSIKGKANLNFDMRPGGEISLTGQYIINDGTYNLTLYDILRRQFKIEEGSSITWSGDPLKAETDITAFYRVRTSPEGLILNELPRVSNEERRELSQSIPFLVYLNIKGELLNPGTIDFDIKTPPGVTIAEVSSKLNQLNQNESAVNKQAVALLTFGSFIQTRMSTEHPVSYEINAAARSSISRILSTQLNKLAEQYIEGLKINVDVTSYADYSGQQTTATTNVALDVEKQFLNERLTVQLGGKVNIEGEEQYANDMNRLAGDVRVLYDLTGDGRFKLKGFNTTEYENIFEGEITKTGLGIIYNQDIYKLPDLFNQKKKENENNE